jgi:cbb3-type cytochrome oxidase maturation protein
MTALAWLIPAALFLGALGLAGFLWSLKSGQFDDLEGAGWRALDDDPKDALPPAAPPASAKAASDVTNG